MTTKPVLWTARELATLTHGTTSGTWSATGLVFNSQAVTPGDVFIALRAADFPTLGGGTTDGHTYIDDALSRGAAGVIASAIPSHLANDQRMINVASTYDALQTLGIAARANSGARFFAITGSVGKTSTREILTLMLSRYGQAYESAKNYNNAMGVPVTLANILAGTDYAVVEMGMNHSGEITPLSQMTRPHVAIITAIAPAHIANFDNGLDGIADAKAEIFKGLDPDGVGIIPKDSEKYELLVTRARKAGVKTLYSFGENAAADARMMTCIEARNGTRVSAIILGETVDYFIPAGKHMAMNALAALLAVKASGLPLAPAISALKDFMPIEGRGKAEKIPLADPDNPVLLIDESYNASPAAMNAAFRVLALIDPGRGGRRIAVLGDMLELGDQAQRLHADLALPLRAANIDLVYTCGTLMKHLHDNLPPELRGAHRDQSSQLAQIVPDVLVPGDVVMVKGSHGSRMDLVVEALRALPAKRTAISESNRHAV